MKRLTDNELEFVKAFNVKPEDWQDYDYKPARMWDYELIGAWGKIHSVPGLHDARTAQVFVRGIEQKFWDPSGFDTMSLEDVGAWVLATFYAPEKFLHMPPERILEELQNWKYYGGFRKASIGEADAIRWHAWDVCCGLVKQAPDCDEIMYIDKEE